MPKRIETGTPEADRLGFSDDLFSGWLEMGRDRRLYLYYIISRYRNEGNTRHLVERWLSEGYDVRVVLPRPIMQHILRKLRFVSFREYLPDHYDDEIEVWRRQVPVDSSGYLGSPVVQRPVQSNSCIAELKREYPHFPALP